MSEHVGLHISDAAPLETLPTGEAAALRRFAPAPVALPTNEEPEMQRDANLYLMLAALVPLLITRFMFAARDGRITVGELIAIAREVAAHVGLDIDEAGVGVPDGFQKLRG